MAEERFARDPEGARELVGEAREEAKRALAELRDLARGIRPSMLAERGLGPALTALAARSPVPAERGPRRPARGCPPPIENAAWFVVSEALANAGKHSGAHPRARARRAASAAGWWSRSPTTASAARTPTASGLIGLRRRVEALDGELAVDQPARRADHDPSGAAMRVVIAEDLALLRDGLIRLLRDTGFEVAAAVEDPDAFLAAVEEHRPDVCVVDVRLPPDVHRRGRARRARGARARIPGLPILILSQYVEQTFAAELFADGRGGVGYLLKDRVADVSDFVASVRRVAEGGTALDPEAVAQLLIPHGPDDPLAALTPREMEVMQLMAEGRTNVRDRARRWRSPRAPSRSTCRRSSASSTCRARTPTTGACWRSRPTCVASARRWARTPANVNGAGYGGGEASLVGFPPLRPGARTTGAKAPATSAFPPVDSQASRTGRKPPPTPAPSPLYPAAVPCPAGRVAPSRSVRR